MQTRKYPRTLAEAFGPYASGPVHAKPEPMHLSDKVAIVSGAIGFVGVVVFALIGWL